MNLSFNKFTLILILLFSTETFAQDLTLGDLQTICSKSNWEYVNQYLINKGWEYYDSQKGTLTKYNTINWSLNRSYGDKAEAWFYLYTYEGFPNKISYSVFNKPAYSKIQNSLSSFGYMLSGNEILDNEITSSYSNSKFILKITTEKRKKENNFSYYEESVTAYRFLLIKKAGIYDPNNGKKVDYWYGDKVKSEYTLINGKVEGEAISYHENGALKTKGFYKDGKANGKFIDYDRNGNKEAEYNMIDDKLNGLARVFEQNKLSIERIYENGLLNGSYIEYHYEEGGDLNIKITGAYKNNEKNGTWYTLFGVENKLDTVEVRNYKKGLKHGEFKEVANSDTIEISNYYNDLREGPYVMKTKNTAYMTNLNVPFDFWNTACEGFYSNGQRVGNWKKYSVGILSEEGTYINDKKNGEWIKYVTIGNNAGEILSVTNYINNLKNGRIENFYELTFVNDTIDGEKITIFNNIPIHESYSYINDSKTGDYILKDSLGNVQVKGQYLDDMETGIWTLYDNNQNIYCTINYDKGNIMEALYFENNEMFLSEKYKDGYLEELGYFRNSKLYEKHIIKSRENKYVVNVLDFEHVDTTFSYVYEVNSQEDYNYRLFRDFGIRHGQFFMEIDNKKLITGSYHQNFKSGNWLYNYPSEDAYAIKEFKSGKLISETFYDNSNKELFSGKITINKPNSHKEIVRIKKGFRNGKTLFFNGKNEEYKSVKYKKGDKIVK